MKRIPYLFPLLLLIGLSLFTACKDDGPDEPSEEDIKREQLSSGSWTVTSADRNDAFEFDLGDQTVTLNFTETGSFTTTGVDALPGDNFPSGGNWEFTTENFDRIELTPTSGSALTLTVSTLDDDTFNFSYETTDDKSGNENFTVTVSASK